MQAFNNIKTVASTVPGNGDVNPYGIAIVPTTTEALNEGSILVSNFNNSANLQGTGTTIDEIDTNGGLKTFAKLSASSLPAAPDQLTIQDVAAVQYTFSNNGPNPYSFSFLEMSILNTTGAFAIAPFQVGGLTFTQATLTQADGTGCFQFATAGASLTATTFSCGLSAFAPAGGWQSLFLGTTAPGTYTAFNAAAEGSAPAAPDQLTITASPEPASLVLLAGGLVVLVKQGLGIGVGGWGCVARLRSRHRRWRPVHIRTWLSEIGIRG